VFLVNGSFNDAVKRGLIRYEELKGAAVRRLTLDNAKNSGMTLVELMVAIGITAIIMMLSTMIFMSQYKSYRTSHGTKTIETDIQKAVECVRDDITLAGWGVKPQMAFYFVDGGNSSPDQVYINDISLMDPNNTKQMQVLVDSFGYDQCGGCRKYQGNSAVTSTGEGCNNSTATYNNLDINCDGSTKELESVPVLVWASGSNATRVRTTDGAGILQNAGLPVDTYVTPAVRYSVDNSTTATPSLLRWARDTGGAQPMAEGVVDLQVIYGDSSTNPASTSDHFGNGTLGNPDNSTAIHPRYGKRGCTAGTDCQMGNFDSSSISWVNLYVVTRSAERRTEDPNDCSSRRPAIANRSAGNATTCGYEYRVYVSQITPLVRMR
jgi:prepilin-type N-terminal cleavage/methylation domain-containing protein